jgi:hypothetical protein
MRLEYFSPDDSEQAGVVLIYDATIGQTQALLDTLDTLRSDQPVDRVLVENLPGCEAIDGCSLALRRAEANLGMHPDRDHPHRFSCTLNPAGWSHAWWMVEPFLVPKPGHFFQYLTEVGPTELIFSTHRGW